MQLPPGEDLSFRLGFAQPPVEDLGFGVWLAQPPVEVLGSGQGRFLGFRPPPSEGLVSVGGDTGRRAGSVGVVEGKRSGKWGMVVGVVRSRAAIRMDFSSACCGCKHEKVEMGA